VAGSSQQQRQRPAAELELAVCLHASDRPGETEAALQQLQCLAVFFENMV
jgi:hypothetical protein